MKFTFLGLNSQPHQKCKKIKNRIERLIGHTFGAARCAIERTLYINLKTASPNKVALFGDFVSNKTRKYPSDFVSNKTQKYLLSCIIELCGGAQIEHYAATKFHNTRMKDISSFCCLWWHQIELFCSAKPFLN